MNRKSKSKITQEGAAASLGSSDDKAQAAAASPTGQQLPAAGRGRGVGRTPFQPALQEQARAAKRGSIAPDQQQQRPGGLQAANVLISGLGGLGFEIAKNIILAGATSVTLHDTIACNWSDLSSNPGLSEENIGSNRAEASLLKLSQLNPSVAVSVSTSSELSEGFLKSFHVVVLTNSSLKKQLKVAEIVRSFGNKLIIGQTRGLFGQVFCDFGPDFTVIDENGKNPASAMISAATKDVDGIVTCMDENKHGLKTGDYVTFSAVDGMTELNDCVPRQIKVLDPLTFTIGDTSGFSNYIRGGFFTQVKTPKKIHFKPLAEALDQPEFIIIDGSKSSRPAQIHIAFRTLDKYIFKNRELPKYWLRPDSKSFIRMAKNVNRQTPEGPAKVEEIDEELLRTFSHVCRGVLSPIDAIIGGVVAQEITKACTGKQTPIVQWLYFDAVECLPRQTDCILSINKCKPTETRYDGLIAVFGADFQKILSNLQYLLVGSGATNCELMKSLAMMGVATGKKGHVYIVDDEEIEEGDLKQTSLFRKQDLTKAKSTVALAALKAINQKMKATAFNQRISPKSESIFDDEFFGKLNGVVNNLIDNQVYTNQRCMLYRKSCITSETSGIKGNIQVVIPRLTQAFSSSEPALVENIPTMASMTSVVAGMACLELLKLSQPMYARQRYKNSCINLALTEFKFSDPIGVPDLMRLQQLRDLPCLPFSHFKKDLEDHSPATDDGWFLRIEAVESGYLQLLIACIDLVTRRVKEVELAMPEWTLSLNLYDLRRIINCDDVLVLFLTLGSFIRPGVSLPRLILPPANGLHLLRSFHSVLSFYLQRKSMIHIAKNVKLYRAIFDIIRSMDLCSALDDDAIISLLGHLRQFVASTDYYISLLQSPDDDISQLSKDVRHTIGRILYRHREASPSESSDDEPWDWDPYSEESYCLIMAALQFTSYRILNRSNAASVHHFAESARSSGEPNNRKWKKRIAQEIATLKASIPLTASGSIFIQHDEERLDILKVLIVGGANSPYANGLFEFDLYFPQNYPVSPVEIRFRTTGDLSCQVRFHFHLHNDGSVRFTRLNTSPDSLKNCWNPNMTVLDILLSIQGWLNSAVPYFDNPRHIKYLGTATGDTDSREYDAHIRSCTVKWAILDHIENPSPWFEKVIEGQFYLNQMAIKKKCEDWIAEMEENPTQSHSFRRNLRSLKDDYYMLRGHLLNLEPPPSPRPSPPSTTFSTDSTDTEDSEEHWQF